MTTKRATGDVFRLYQTVLAHVQSGLWNDSRNVRCQTRFTGSPLLSERDPRRAHFGPLYAALAHPLGGPERWHRVSDESTGTETFDEYGERFRIEEGVLDDNGGLFNLGSRTHRAKCLCVLLARRGVMG